MIIKTLFCRELQNIYVCFSAYMSGSSSPSTSSAPTIYQLSSLPPPSTLSDVAIDSDLLKPPGKNQNGSDILLQCRWIFSLSSGSLTEYLERYETAIKILTTPSLAHR